MENKAGSIFMWSKKSYKWIHVFSTPEEKLREARKKKLEKINKNLNSND